jgi:prepilin-type N-terminal cleavage/methylation domain-containing protein
MKFCPRRSQKNGFTLIELLVVIGILAILLSIVLIAINPARQFGQANNTRRRSDVTQILNAVGAYAADHHGILPAAITDTAKDVSKIGADICADIMPTYIPALPQDPKTGAGTQITDCTTYDTGYTIVKDANNRVTVAAPEAENSEIITITR